MTSRPLLTRVAELIVTTGPMFQVGWASACLGVTSASSGFVRPRNGPPEAVTTSLRTSERLPAASAWKSAECSESTGTIWPGLATALTSGPPTIRDSLLASASTRPASRAARVGARPMDPVMPLSTVWQSLAASSAAASGPARISGCRAEPYAADSASRTAGTASFRATATVPTSSRRACSARSPARPPAADRPVTRKRPGLRCTTSMACVPIEPVEPRITMSRGPPVAAVAAGKVRCGWARESVIPPLSPHRLRAPDGAPAERAGGRGRRPSGGAPAGAPGGFPARSRSGRVRIRYSSGAVPQLRSPACGFVAPPRPGPRNGSFCTRFVQPYSFPLRSQLASAPPRAAPHLRRYLL